MSSVSPPLPSTRRCCGTRFPSFLVGLVIGAALAGIAANVFIQRERARFGEVTGVGQAGQDFFNGLGNLVGHASAGTHSEAEKIKTLGDESVDDLRQGRLLAVYKLTTAEYKSRVKREDFDKMVAEVPNVRLIFPAAMRESKVRKATDSDGYEYYCSSGSNNFSGNVVFSFAFEPGDNGSWRISQFELNYANK